MIYRFRFWKEWCDEQGRMWAEPHDSDSAVDARKAHTGAMSWMWVGDKVRPSVSDLYSVAFAEDPVTGKKREQSRTTIQDGGRREYHEAALSGVRSSGDGGEVSDARRAVQAVKERGFDGTPF
jgi:hypothetical protein